MAGQFTSERSSDENQKPELSQARQRFVIEKHVLERSEMVGFDEYVDVLSGKTPERAAYRRLLGDARLGKVSHGVVERVIVNAEGIVKLALRTPFAYLKDLTDEIRSVNRREGIRPQMKIGGDVSADFHPEGSNWIQVSWESCSQVEHSTILTTFDFIQRITFPQRANLARFTNPDLSLAVR